MSADSYRELAKRGPHDLVQSDRAALRPKRPGQTTRILAAPGAVPRLNEIYTPMEYSYGGTEHDIDTPAPDLPAVASARRAPARPLLAMCPVCWDGADDWVPCMGGNCCCACRDDWEAS